MGGFFSLEGPFYKFGSILADIMILSLIWLVCSIPFVTVGASTTAVYYVMTRRISNREGYIFRDFFSSFKSNFMKSTGVWLLTLLVLGILYINIRNIEVVENEIMRLIILPFQICFIIELCLLHLYVYCIIARFDMNFKETLKTAFFMANKHLLTSIGSLVLAVVIVLACVMYPLFALIAIGVFIYLQSFLLIKVFKKYRPEIDKDPDDIALEQASAENAESIEKSE